MGEVRKRLSWRWESFYTIDEEGVMMIEQERGRVVCREVNGTTLSKRWHIVVPFSACHCNTNLMHCFATLTIQCIINKFICL